MLRNYWINLEYQMENYIRFIAPSDIQSILNIYGYYIESTAITFETEVPTRSNFSRRVKEISKFYPWLVFDEHNEIKGYAYASPHRQREAYQWSVDVTVYLTNNSQGKGIGTLLYRKLFQILIQQGFYNAYAGIALPNEKSVGLHEKLGFSKVAEYNRVGYKLDKWWNVGWWELNLQSKHNSPTPPRSIEVLNLGDYNRL